MLGWAWWQHTDPPPPSHCTLHLGTPGGSQLIFKIKKEIQFYLNKYNKNSLSGSWVDVNIIKFLPTKSFFLQYLIQFSLYIGFDEMTSVQFSQCAVLTKVNVLAPIRGLPTSTTSPSPPPRPLRQLLPPPAFSDHSWQELSSSCFHSGGWPYTLHLTPYNWLLLPNILPRYGKNILSIVV